MDRWWPGWSNRVRPRRPACRRRCRSCPARRHGRTAGSTPRTGRAGRPGPAGPVWGGNPGSGPSAAVSPRARRPSGRGRRPPGRSPGRMHCRGRRTCHAAAWPPVGGDLAGTARAGECRRAVAAPRTVRRPRGVDRCAAARRGMAVPGTARCPGAGVRYAAARRGLAVRGTARCPGAGARCGLAVRGMARCPGAGARCGLAVWGMARCPGAAARCGAAAPAVGRCGWRGARRGGAGCPAVRCRPEGAGRRAAMAHWEGRLPGPRPCARVAVGLDRRAGPNRRPAAGKSRDRRGRCAVGGGPAHPTGRAAARRRAHPQNPWRERIPLSG